MCSMSPIHTFLRIAAVAILLATVPSSAVLAAYHDPQKDWSDDTHPLDRGVTPVTEALCVHPDDEDTFDYALSGGQESGFMTDEQVEAYIAARYSEGKVTAEDWLQSYNLFSACMWLAYQNKDIPEERQRWLSIALDAARQNLQYDCLNVTIAFDTERSFKNEEAFDADKSWFFGRLVDAYREHLEGDERQRAITLYNIGKALGQKGDYVLAKEAFKSAQELFPGDYTILRSLKETYEKLGDYAAAIEALDKMGWTLKEEDMDSINGLINAAVHGMNAGDLYLLLEDIEKAQSVFELAWAYLHRFDIEYAEQSAVWEADSGIPRENPAHMDAGYVNQCATGLGLCALAKGDLKKAIEWFRESFVNSQYMAFKGYDLRLVKELMKDPALRELCISYLQLALEAKMTKKEDEVKALLAQLTGERVDPEVRTGNHSDQADESMPDGKVDEGVPGDMAKQKTNPQQTRAEQAAPQNSQKNRKITGAVVAVIIAAVLAVIYANRRKKAKGGKNDI